MKDILYVCMFVFVWYNAMDILHVCMLVLIEEFQVVGFILLFDDKTEKNKAPALVLKFFLSCNWEWREKQGHCELEYGFVDWVEVEEATTRFEKQLAEEQAARLRA